MKYKPRHPSHPHQLEALKKMRGKEAFALLMAMRKGKSKVLLDDFGQLELDNEVKDLLIEAPGGVYKTWQTQIADHLSEDLLERALVHTWNSGMGVGEKRRLDHFLKQNDPSRPRILLLNAEAISRPGLAREASKAFLKLRRGKRMMAIDESTLNMNPRAKRTGFNNRILAPLTEWRRILTGLVAPKNPLDLFSQFEFLDWEILGHKSFYTYRARYAIMKPMNFGGRWVQVVDGYQNVEEIQQLIEPNSFRVEFRPNVPSTYDTWAVEMSAVQKRIYAELRDDATAVISGDSHVTATAVIVQILRLHQLLMGRTVDDATGEICEVPEHRTSALLELLDDYSGKAVIWCSYDEDIRKVSAALEKHFKCRVARFWGGNTKTREAEEKQFQTDPNFRFMAATPDAGGKGRMWEVADLVVYYSSKNNLEHREQSEQRVQGMTKQRAVDYVDMICPGTVEMPILQALREKINMSTVINGDNYREWLL